MVGLAFAWCAALLVGALGVAPERAWAAVGPVLTSLSPASGSSLGGQEVAINGEGLFSATSVRFGAAVATFGKVNDNKLIAIAPPGTGTVDIVVTTPDGATTISAASQYTYLDLPFIDAISPANGPGGTVVTITGRNLTGVTSVMFGAVPATSFTVQSNTSIVATAPAAAAGSWVEIQVIKADGPNPPTAAADFQYSTPPTITALTPASGPTTGGASVTITGTGLSAVTDVMFGSTPATTFFKVSNTRIQAIAPPGGLGVVNVTVMSPNGASATSASTAFTYNNLPVLGSLTPSSGPDSGGNIVALSGGGFLDVQEVRFGTTSVPFTVDSPTRILATAPAGEAYTSVNVTVVTAASTTSGRTYSYVARPVVTGVSESPGLSGQVTIGGYNLQSPTSVKFGNLTASVVSSAPESLVVSIPAGVPGQTVDVIVTNTGGSSEPTMASRFTFGDAVGAVPVLDSVSPRKGPQAGGTIVQLQGSNFTGATAVYFGMKAAAFTVDSDTQITTTAPMGEETVKIRVNNIHGPSMMWDGAVFEYAIQPVVESMMPSSGVAGTTVLIEGRFFSEITEVKFGSASATIISQTNGSVTVLAPPGAGGAQVTVQTAGGINGPSSASLFNYLTAPTISSLNPPRINVAGGASVVITGEAFTGATAVTFGATSATAFTVDSDTQITAIAPAGAAGIVNVVVSTPNGSSAGRAIAYGAAPTVSVIAPGSGWTSGGTSVTISGSNFTGVTSVKFGDAEATSLSVTNDTQIVAVSPAGTGLVALTITSPDGEAVTSQPAQMFQYLAPPSIVTASLNDASTGLDHVNVIVTSGLSSDWTLSVVDGALPPGLFIDPSSQKRIVGRATATGAFPITLKAADDTGASAIRAYVLNVVPTPLDFTRPGIAAMTLGQAYSENFPINGGVSPYGFAVTAGELPAGLTLATNGALSGVPTVSGPYDFTVTVTDSTGGDGPYSLSKQYTGEVGTNPPLTTPLTVTVDYNALTPIDLAASISGPAATSITVTTQPAHGSVAVNGLVATYTPTAGYVGPDSFAYTASGPGGTSEPATVSITVQAPVFVFQPQTLADATQAVAYSATIGATGGTAPYSYSIVSGALPAGLEMSAGGIIQGMPTASGVFNFTVKVTDASTGLGASATHAFTLTVGAPPAPAAEPKEVTVEIQPGPNGGSAQIDLSDAVQYASGIQIVRQPTHGTLTVDGFTVTYTPNPGYYGEDSFDYVAVPIANNPAASRMARAAPVGATVTITIAPPTLVFGQTTLPNGQEDTAYSQTLTASGGTAPYSFAVTTGALPAGLTLSTAGVLSGTPTVGGVFTFTVTATDSSTGTGPFTVAQAFTLTLKAATPEVAAPIEVATIQGKEVIVDLTAGATGGPFTGAAVVTLTPADAGEAKIVETGSGATRGYALSFKSTGAFSGVATVTYTLSNASGPSAPGTVSITVEARPDPSQDPDVRGIVTAQTDAAVRMAEAQIGNFGRRMESLHSGGSRRFQQGVTLGFGFADGGLIDPWTQREIDMDRSFNFRPETMASAVSQNPTTGLVHPRGLMAGGASGAGGSSGSGVATEGQVSIWTGGSIQFGRRDPKNGDAKFDFTTAGLSMGADIRVNERLAVGVGGGFGQSDADVGSKGSSVEATNWFGVLYGSYQPVDGAFIDGMIGYGQLDFDTRRKVSAGVLTPTDVYAVGSRSGDQLILSVSAGWDFRRGDLFISPYARVSSITGTLDAYAETGAGLGNLRYEDQDLSSLKIALGARGERTFKSSFGMVTPRFRLEYQRELKDSELATVSYDDWVGGPLFSVIADPFERDQWVIGIGGELRRKRSKFSLDYQGNLASGRDFVSELTGQISIDF